MHPRTKEVVDVLDSYRAALEQAVGDVPASLHGTRPAPERWSVAEVLEHLGIVEGRIGQLVLGALATARTTGIAAEVDTSPVAAMFDVTGLLDRSTTVTASQASWPSAGLSTEAGWAALTERRRALRDAVVAADGLALGSIVVPHARFGNLNLYQWLLFLAGHEGRHTAQIRETAAAVQPV